MTGLPRGRLGAYVLPGASPDPVAGLEQARATERLGLGALWIGDRCDAHVRRGLLPPDTQMGHGNSLTQALARRLGLPVPELSGDYLLHRSGRLRQDAIRSTSKAGR